MGASVVVFTSPPGEWGGHAAAVVDVVVQLGIGGGWCLRGRVVRVDDEPDDLSCP